MVISVSRRCDIPRFAFAWFMERLDAGHVDVKNPFNSQQIRRVSLSAPALFAFWTRDPASILENAGELERRGFGFFAMCSLTDYPALLEPNAPNSDAVMQTMKRLAQKTTPDRVIWRYDPVFLSDITDYDFHRRNFANLAARLNGTVKRVIVSMYDGYAKPEKRLAKLEQGGSLKRLAHNADAVRKLLAELAQIARREGMEMQSCAEEDLSACGVRPGACIDGEYIERVFGMKAPARDRNQRPRCLCAQSVDIGSYGACPAGCVYCYGL